MNIQDARSKLEDRRQSLCDAQRERFSTTTPDLTALIVFLENMAQDAYRTACKYTRAVRTCDAYEDPTRFSDTGLPRPNGKHITLTDRAKLIADGILADEVSNEAVMLVYAAIDLADAESELILARGRAA